MNNVKIPIGVANVTVETDAEKAARLLAEQEAELAAQREKNGGKTDQELADEAAAAAAAGNSGSSGSSDEPEKVILVIEDKEVEYNLDKDGNVLDKDGKVLYTAAQLKEFEGGKDDTSNNVTEVAKLTGIKILDEKGTEKVYEDTVEGFAQREMDIKQLGINEGKQTALESFFAANPEIKSLYEYKRTYGNLDNYGSYVDYSKVVLDKDNSAQLEDIIYKAEIAKGNSEERAKRIVNFAKADNSLLIDAEESLKFLSASQEKDRQAAAEREQLAMQKAIEDEYRYYGIGYDDKGNEKILNVEGSVYDLIVTKGTIGNINIPKDGLLIKQADGTAKHLSRRQIFDYIYTPIAEIEGVYYSQAQIDEYNRLKDTPNLLSTYIMNLLGGDVSQLVEISKRKDNANAVKRFVLKTSSRSSSSSSNSNSKKVVIPIKN